MPTVDPASSATATAPNGTAAHAVPGFGASLHTALDRTRVTLGQMVGLDPLPPGAYAAAMPAAVGAAIGGALPGIGGSISEGGHPAVEAAAAYLGTPYRWGGTDPATGLDCSGLVQRAFADIGVALPRVSADQARSGTAVDSLAEAVPGDLVYWAGRDGRPNHIGIYLGDGKMLHAPRTGEVVRVDDVRAAPPDAIRRVLPGA